MARQPVKEKKRAEPRNFKKNRYSDWAKRLAQQNPSTHASRTAPDD